MWKSLGGIMVNIVPQEVPRPKSLGACGPSGFWPWNSLGTKFTSIPPRHFHTLYQYCETKFFTISIINNLEFLKLNYLIKMLGFDWRWNTNLRHIIVKSKWMTRLTALRMRYPVVLQQWWLTIGESRRKSDGWRTDRLLDARAASTYGTFSPSEINPRVRP